MLIDLHLWGPLLLFGQFGGRHETVVSEGGQANSKRETDLCPQWFSIVCAWFRRLAFFPSLFSLRNGQRTPAGPYITRFTSLCLQ